VFAVPEELDPGGVAAVRAGLHSLQHRAMPMEWAEVGEDDTLLDGGVGGELARREVGHDPAAHAMVGSGVGQHIDERKTAGQWWKRLIFLKNNRYENNHAAHTQHQGRSRRPQWLEWNRGESNLIARAPVHWYHLLHFSTICIVTSQKITTICRWESTIYGWHRFETPSLTRIQVFYYFPHDAFLSLSRINYDLQIYCFSFSKTSTIKILRGDWDKSVHQFISQRCSSGWMRGKIEIAFELVIYNLVELLQSSFVVDGVSVL
jgi:hypothetical protein